MMPPSLKLFVKRLGIPGSMSLVGSLIVFLLVIVGSGVAAFIAIFITIPFLLWLAIRLFLQARRRTLWSVRNRLLFVYGLFGALPLLLVVTFIGLGLYIFTNELAIYLASSALDRQLNIFNAAVDALERQAPDQRANSGPEIAKAFNRVMPDMVVYVNDSTGSHCYPASAQPLTLPRGWKNAHGLIVVHHRFYGWTHHLRDGEEFTALAPLTNQLIQQLVPNLGEIAIIENPVESDRKDSEPKDRKDVAAAGSLEVKQVSRRKDPDFVTVTAGPSKASAAMPPAWNRFDIPIIIPSTQVHYHLENPNQPFNGVLSVRSRPSAVLKTFFSGSEVIRDVLFDSLLAIAILFLIVELIAIWIGVSLSRRITGAVSQLYEGTRRVISGDFRHRIPVRDSDQLGELAQSFNQMTGNLERLLVVEKEKERLQTEVEIAREVQSQLYPKAAVPTCGLKLTVRCDPARMVSGDYYDYVQVSRDKIMFAMGDVAGKGISAALLMATLQAALRAQINAYTPVRETECSEEPQIHVAALVSKLNRQIFAHTSPEKYATFFFGVFDEVSCSLTYTNAGHLSPLLFRNDQVITLDSNGTVVGAFPFAKYDESCLIFKPNDLLVCYTDGITEPENAYGEMFGEERLIALVQKHKHQDDDQIVDTILDAVRGWTGTPELHDDMTLLLARHVATPA